MCGLGSIGEGQRHSWEPLANGLRNQAERQSVADASCPFVDGVASRWCHDDSVRRRQYISLVWVLVFAAHRVPGECFERQYIDEFGSLRRGDQADVPADMLRWLDQLIYFTCWRRGSG